MTAILHDGLTYAKAHAPSDISVLAVSSDLLFTTSDKRKQAALVAFKKKVGEYLKNKYPHRAFLHSLLRRNRVWWIGERGEAGLRCGIRVKELSGDELLRHVNSL